MTEEDNDRYMHLIADYQGLIRAFIVSQLPGAPGVDDVIQETNSVLWRKREEFDLETNFKAWALAVARFQVMAHRKVLKSRRWVSLDERAAELIATDMQDFLDCAREERRLACLRQCLDELGEQDQELVLQRYWHKTRLQDFAVITGRTVAALKGKLFRIRAALKKCIEEKLELANPSP